jgi:protein-S-isoprenylcysteine O-methyltransferase Ste14
MSSISAHNTFWQTAEVVFGVPFLIAVALDRAVRLPLPDGVYRLIFIAVGIALIVAGLAIISRARKEFARSGQPTDPGHPTTRLVTTGVFSISRNPLYLGGAIFLAGVSLTANLAWGLILLIPSLLACHWVLIAPEERYLLALFGEEYRAYAARVHRWIGRQRNRST